MLKYPYWKLELFDRATCKPLAPLYAKRIQPLLAVINAVYPAMYILELVEASNDD